MKRSRHSQDYQNDDDEEWTVEGSSSSPASSSSSSGLGGGQASAASRLRRANREVATRTASLMSRNQSANAVPLAPTGVKKTMPPQANGEKVGGLPLPDVVRELLKEKSILRWDAKEGVYEVLHGENFERRFNDLRKVRSKVKAAGTERPFSRMYNFYILEHGDKWARTGTKFRPRCPAAEPTPEILAQVKQLETKQRVVEKPSSPVSANPPAGRNLARVPAAASATTARAASAVSAASTKPAPAPAVAAHPGRSAPEGELVSRRTRDTSFRGANSEIQGNLTSSTHSTARSSTAAAAVPPPAPRHQPAMPPLAPANEMRALSKRAHYAVESKLSSSAPPSNKVSLSEQIARAFRNAGMEHVVGVHRPHHAPPAVAAPAMSYDPAPTMRYDAAPCVRYEHAAPAPYAYSHSHMQARPEEVHYHEDMTELHKSCGVTEYMTVDQSHMHVAEDAARMVEAAKEYCMSRYSHHVEMHPVYRVGSPISSEDASSGFPSPESLLALGGEFLGSPLDLGDPELSVFGDPDASSSTHAVRTMQKEPAMLEDPFEPMEPWTALHSVMW